MKEFSINGQVRKKTGKKATRELRKQGLVPCNIYGQGMDNVLFTVDAKELKAITNTPNSYIIDLKLSDGKEMMAVLHEAQWHPVTDEAMHIDFLAVSEDKPVVINVPVQVTGHSEGVKLGGKLYVAVRKLRISALMAKLPDFIEVDVTSLQIGKQIVAGDLNIDGVNIVSPKGTIICSVLATRASQQAAAE